MPKRLYNRLTRKLGSNETQQEKEAKRLQKQRIKEMKILPDPALERIAQCPSLPPELWLRILSHHTDVTHLWTTCRLVSTSFLAYTEQVFCQKYVKSVQIDWELEEYNLGGTSRRPVVPMQFHAFSRDREKKVAYFRDKRDKSEVCPQKWSRAKPWTSYEQIMLRWEANVKGTRAEMPNYTIVIEGLVNDTSLPTLDINVADREISFDWRAMLTAFFKQERRLEALRKLWETENSAPPENKRTCTADSMVPHGDPVPKPWSVADLEIRKQVRRERLKEHYADNDEMVWALNSLQYYEDSNVNPKGGPNGSLSYSLSAIPETGIGEKWFGHTYMVQSLFLDEWSCLQRIDAKVMQLKKRT
ncbi:hypothetical protein M011DRAFT_479963 [Sporormia fimetaria CBS 119925]|uniref:F-box domain-containing protein n=1 Tax=Sporormia fimetaria CBS 119925 TaxID=1340428 RepID=A0A6A6V2Z0_9PLEO|nr:hypothetical protein M011DRAFT_479963 [Sporormia fimetaria CBS 119925]